MKRFQSFILLFIVFCLIFSGCGKPQSKPETVELRCGELCASLMETDISLDCDIKSSYGEEKFESYFSYLYDMPIDYIKDGCILYVSSGDSADEVSLLLPADAGKGALITTALNHRIARRKQDYNGYNDKEVKKLENAAVMPVGNYIALIISDQPNQIAKALRSML